MRIQSLQLTTHLSKASKLLLAATLMTMVSGCANLAAKIPNEWLDPPSAEEAFFDDEDASERYARQHYKANPSQESAIIVTETPSGFRVPATTQLTDDGLQLQAEQGCGGCHQGKVRGRR